MYRKYGEWEWNVAESCYTKAAWLLNPCDSRWTELHPEKGATFAYIDKGLYLAWMEDWDASLKAARHRVRTPTIQSALCAAAEGRWESISNPLDEHRALELLDAAILLGQVDAVSFLSAYCRGQRPQRVWNEHDLLSFDMDYDVIRLKEVGIVEALIKSGADVSEFFDLPRAAIFSGNVFVARHASITTLTNAFALKLSLASMLSHHRQNEHKALNMDILKAAKAAGVDLNSMELWDYDHLLCGTCLQCGEGVYLSDMPQGPYSVMSVAILLADMDAAMGLVKLGCTDSADGIEWLMGELPPSRCLGLCSTTRTTSPSIAIRCEIGAAALEQMFIRLLSAAWRVVGIPLLQRISRSIVERIVSFSAREPPFASAKCTSLRPSDVYSIALTKAREFFLIPGRQSR